jgi:hypothetical protein
MSIFKDNEKGGGKESQSYQRKVEVEAMLTDNLVLEVILFALFIFSMT